MCVHFLNVDHNLHGIEKTTWPESLLPLARYVK